MIDPMLSRQRNEHLLAHIHAAAPGAVVGFGVREWGPGGVDLHRAAGASDEAWAAAQAALAAFDWQAADLSLAREAKAAEIDARTAELQALGFEFPPGSGQRFDLTPESQSLWVSMMVAAGAGLLTYPVSAGVLGDGTYELRDASAVAVFCAAALARGRAIIEKGAALKKLVYEAATPEAVAAVADTRE